MNTNILQNLILFTDSYKISHVDQYPPNTKYVFSYIESRGSKVSQETLVFGLQRFIKEYLAKPITKADIDIAEKIITAHGFQFNRYNWEYILDKYNGFLPLEIRSVKEGTVVPLKNVLLTVVNTDPKCFWLTSYLETALLQNFWYPTTVASNTFQMKRTIYNALRKSSDNPDSEINFKLHCFGFRGASSLETAAIGNCAHLVNFFGTDTIAGISCAMTYYDADVCGFSIPASEHSTMTSWTESGELDAYTNMVNKFAKPGAVFACVIDSYDTFGAIDLWVNSGLLNKVAEKGATVVLRPDSGDPITMPIRVIKYLMEKVGYTINSKGYKVLPAHVRVIQGDGITVESIPKIIDELLTSGLSMSNLAFGMGAGTLQKVDRDTYKFAMKCSSITTASGEIDVYKNPKTDPGKASKRGRLTLVKDVNGNMVTKRVGDVNSTDVELLRTVYKNGPINTEFENFSQIRSRAALNI